MQLQTGRVKLLSLLRAHRIRSYLVLAGRFFVIVIEGWGLFFMYDVVIILSISNWVWFIWAISLAFGWLVLVFGDFLGDIVRHGDVIVPFIGVPIQVNSTV